jgi:alkylated DNA repair protein (DNA oxidative demethylase)
MNYQTIFDGAYLFSNALTSEEETYFASLYERNKHLLYTPILSSGRSMSLEMTCFGKHWNPKTYQYSIRREDYDQQMVEEFPSQTNEILAKFLFPFNDQYQPEWDIGILNYYSSKAKLGLHADNSESLETMQSGHPIVSVSFGASCVFRMGGYSRTDKQYKNVVLNSGDVLIFGGPSRMRYHSVIQIVENEEQSFTCLPSNARLNFTFRKF